MPNFASIASKVPQTALGWTSEGISNGSEAALDVLQRCFDQGSPSNGTGRAERRRQETAVGRSPCMPRGPRDSYVPDTGDSPFPLRCSRLSSESPAVPRESNLDDSHEERMVPSRECRPTRTAWECPRLG